MVVALTRFSLDRAGGIIPWLPSLGKLDGLTWLVRPFCVFRKGG